jgi:thymidylate kinase
MESIVMIVCIEGVDRCGKSTVCSHLQNEHGFGYMHFSKPEGSNNLERAHFQKGTFDRMFKFVEALEKQEANIVLDRAHLGELVYGPMYRGDSGVDLSYIHELERLYGGSMILILMVHQNLDVIRDRDDGLGFDISKLEKEQELFVSAFIDSQISTKTILDVTDLDIPQVLAKLEALLGLPSINREMWYGDYLRPSNTEVKLTPVRPKLQLIKNGD